MAETAKHSAALSADLTAAGKEREAKGAVDVISRVEARDGPAAVAAESKKGFDLLFIGLEEMNGPDGGFANRVNELAAGFDGPIALAIGSRSGVVSPSRLIIPVNGTDISRLGAELAFAVVSPAHAHCVALHVSELPDTPGAERAVLDDIAELGDRHGFNVATARHRDTAPADAILREAVTRRSNFVVIGANRRVGDTLMLGKTVNALLQDWEGNLVILAN